MRRLPWGRGGITNVFHYFFFKKIIIPARYNSRRFPGKPLVKIYGKTMLERVWLNAMDSAASEVIIATDDQRIEAVAKNFANLHEFFTSFQVILRISLRF